MGEAGEVLEKGGGDGREVGRGDGKVGKEEARRKGVGGIKFVARKGLYALEDGSERRGRKWNGWVLRHQNVD